MEDKLVVLSGVTRSLTTSQIVTTTMLTEKAVSVCSSGVFADTDAVKSVSVMEGDSVSLNSDTEIQKGDKITWTFGTNGNLIAKAKNDGVKNMISDNLDERFRDRLKLDKNTGSLTITNIRSDHAGVYEVEISRSSSSSTYRFTVTVYARLPIPVIGRNSSNCSSSVCKCVLLCSVLNVSDVTLSWYAGMSVMSNISVCDLSISLSLPLEIECLDDSYSCVVASSFTNWTTHLNTELCQTCPDCVFCCHVSEAVIRLVISALVGVAAACIVVYDITSRKQERT
ncbi:uncharacterized protein LOC130086991 [Rhinichthys klamathensis goyatoka]|uniref:uncharacterized protein LOC130086991 n=1 Tax=Rhinichthys klamathensis goyatoka TaxID=3034132 RepID=UPI0024B4D061|nr:uncharacterized protein LOC130086991 [Rhinichthys klamathensis goyatoka]